MLNNTNGLSNSNTSKDEILPKSIGSTILQSQDFRLTDRSVIKLRRVIFDGLEFVDLRYYYIDVKTPEIMIPRKKGICIRTSVWMDQILPALIALKASM